MARSCRRHIVLIDPVMTGDGFRRAAHDRGHVVTSVYTLGHDVLETVARGRRDGPDKVVHASTVKAILSSIDRPVHAVIAASEPGVAVADFVAQALNLPRNDPATASARRYKDSMRRHARRHGVPAPRFEVVAVRDARRLHEALIAAADRIGFPAILKPNSGAASHGVQVLTTREDACHELGGLVSRDIFGHPVRSWMVEEYLVGREIAVNCFSDGTTHHLVDMWEYRQPAAGPYDQPYWDLIQLAADDPDWSRAASAVRRVLSVYGIRIGPSHTEVKITSDGVRLIEVGARLPGARMTEHWALHSRFDAYDETLSAFLEPSSISTGARLPEFDARLGICCLRNDRGQGRLLSLRGVDAVAALPQTDAIYLDYKVGDQVPATKDLNSLFGKALLSANTLEALLHAHDQVRQTIEMEIAEPWSI